MDVLFKCWCSKTFQKQSKKYVKQTVKSVFNESIGLLSDNNWKT